MAQGGRAYPDGRRERANQRRAAVVAVDAAHLLVVLGDPVACIEYAEELVHPVHPKRLGKAVWQRFDANCSRRTAQGSCGLRDGRGLRGRARRAARGTRGVSVRRRRGFGRDGWCAH